MENTGLGEQLNSLKIRGMKVVLTLQKGAFPAHGGANVKTIYATSLPGYLHVDAMIQRLPAWLGNNAIVTIYGMTKDDCEAATKFNSINIQYYNQIQIFAGYISPTPNKDGSFDQQAVIAECDKLSQVFLGQILSAGVDYNDPNRPFVLQANVTAQSVVRILQSTVTNTSHNFSQVVTTMITTHNNSNPQIRYELDSVNPDQIVNNCYYTGSFKQQLETICTDYNYQFNILMPSTNSPNTQRLEFTKIGISTGRTKTTLNSSTGMIGYPTVLPFGIAIKEFFNPRRSINDNITLDTYYTPLKGNYYVWQMQSQLQTNDAAWETTLTLYSFDNTAFEG